MILIKQRKLCRVIQDHPSPQKAKRRKRDVSEKGRHRQNKFRASDASSRFFPPISGPHSFPADCVRESHLLPSRPPIPLPGRNFPSHRPTSWLPPLRYLRNHGQWQIICLCGVFAKNAALQRDRARLERISSR